MQKNNSCPYCHWTDVEYNPRKEKYTCYSCEKLFTLEAEKPINQEYVHFADFKEIEQLVEKIIQTYPASISGNIGYLFYKAKLYVDKFAYLKGYFGDYEWMRLK